MLVDIGIAINTGNLNYNLWVISQYTEMVVKYLKYRKYTAYDIFRLLATLDLKCTNQDIDHGKMTAIILYKRQYTVQRHDHLILSFALRYRVSLCCVLELPILLSIGATFWKTVLHRTQSKIFTYFRPTG